jgi:branched-chain amino acid transport system substrate-binding protein
MRRGFLKVRWLSIWACLIAVLAFGVAACGDDGGSSGDSGDSTSGGKTLTIYSSLPLQGDSRPQSEDVVRGMKLALEQKGGKVGDFTIKYVSLDDATAAAGKWEPGQVSANARKAVGDDTTIAYLGEFNSGASAISIPILNDAGILQVSPSNTYVERRAGQVLPVRYSQLRPRRARRPHPGGRPGLLHEGQRLHQGRDPE